MLHLKRRAPPAVWTSETCRLSSQRRPNVDPHIVQMCAAVVLVVGAEPELDTVSDLVFNDAFFNVDVVKEDGFARAYAAVSVTTNVRSCNGSRMTSLLSPVGNLLSGLGAGFVEARRFFGRRADVADAAVAVVLAVAVVVVVVDAVKDGYGWGW